MIAKRQMWIVSMVALVALTTFTVALGMQIRRSSKRAAAFLQDASALQLRVATPVEVQQLVSKYGGEIESGTCGTQDNCTYFFSFENVWLHRLHLAPRTRLSSTLGVGDGVLNYRRVFLISGDTSAVFGAFVDERLSSPPGGVPKPFHVSRQSAGSGERWRVHIDMTADATPEQHRMAYAFNLRCLSRLGGCEDAQQLLPSITWPSDSSNRGL